MRDVITKEKMLPMLIEACPSFTDKWNEHKQEYYDEEDFLPYIALGEFTRHLTELYHQNQTAEFDKVFELVATLHIDGDDYVREAATIGLLEGLLGEDAEYFAQHLRPVSLKWWNELNKFWNGKIKYVRQTIN